MRLSRSLVKQGANFIDAPSRDLEHMNAFGSPDMLHAVARSPWHDEVAVIHHEIVAVSGE